MKRDGRSTSVRSLVVKHCVAIVLSMIGMVVLFYRDHFIPAIVKIDDHFETLIVIVFVGVMIGTMLFSLYEIIHIRRELPGKQAHNAILVPVQIIFQLLRENDIMDIEIVHGDQPMHIGVSSVSNAGDEAFHDKLYYSGEFSYADFDQFEQVINRYTEQDGMVMVLSIDELPPTDYTVIECFLKDHQKSTTFDRDD